MAYDGWLNYNGTELVNLSRTAQLANALGIDSVWITPQSVQWIQDALGGVAYGDITEAPWYDADYPASAEFAGLVPLSLVGLDDSTRESKTVEYVTDGGNSGKPRNATLPIVAGFAVVARTDRGADYGKRWMDRILHTAGTQMFCSGAELTYFRFRQQVEGEVPFKAHRRDVSLSRGASITRKRAGECSTTWTVTFTLVANDPFEYGEEWPQFTDLGGVPVGPGVASSGTLDMLHQTCPVYNYSPIYDPLYPALVAPPTAPDFYPDGWNIKDGDAFRRYWTRLHPVEPSLLRLVPFITLTGTVEARRVWVSIFPAAAAVDEQCEPLFSAIANYVPANQQFIIDGEQQAVYVWDGVSALVRRADSVVYGPDAAPLEWTSFNDPGGLLVTLDIFALEGGGYEGGDTVRMALDLIPKSD